MTQIRIHNASVTCLKTHLDPDLTSDLNSDLDLEGWSHGIWIQKPNLNLDLYSDGKYEFLQVGCHLNSDPDPEGCLDSDLNSDENPDI